MCLAAAATGEIFRDTSGRTLANPRQFGPSIAVSASLCPHNLDFMPVLHECRAVFCCGAIASQGIF